MKIRLSTAEEDPDWEAFVAASPVGHLLQSPPWGALKARFGWRPLRLLIEEEQAGSNIVAGAQLLFRPLPLGSLAYVPRGPVADPSDRDLLAFLLSALHRVARQERAIFLKLEPPWEDDPSLDAFLRAHGFRPSPQTIQPRTTLLLDLTADLDELLARMKPKTRYNIRLAKRKGVVVREGSEEDLSIFYRLLQVTSQRDGFAIHTREYYEEAWHRFAPRGMARLLVASYRGEILAGLMAFALGRTAWYLYGASSDRHRNLMPNHLLQWEAIQWAKARGCTTYDLWGIPDEVGRALARGEEPEQGTGGLWGVYRFKRGFGGRVARTLGAYDAVYQPVLYWLGVRVLSRLRTR
ncbi:MAG TPA: peptidoglycan bridge formation glycyltransferase FemA/FemB family protein [Anaerolineae bacterium]|nr:peptidoglycan bridge formation glycyltransferase FemA/FemB family protein [Anaerolineae bacterium]